MCLTKSFKGITDKFLRHYELGKDRVAKKPQLWIAGGPSLITSNEWSFL